MATMKTLNGYGFNATELGGKAPEYYIQPRNLLDNSDFTNPVNQRGVTSETDILRYAYFIDRWHNSADTTTKYGLSNQGVTISGNAGIRQEIEGIGSGTVLTGAVKYGGKIICVTGTIEYNDTSYKTIAYYGDGTANVFLITQGGNAGIMISKETSVSSITVEWAALYKGSYTADTLPPYVPKGYAAELAECMRYYIEIGTQPVNGWCYDWGQVHVFVPTPTLMRQENPSVILNTASSNYFYIGSTSYDATLIGGNSISNGMLVSYSHEATVRGQCIIPEFSAKISADL